MYLQNVLSTEENRSFERHVLHCGHCQERIEDEVNSLLALRRSAQACFAASQPKLGHALPAAFAF